MQRARRLPFPIKRGAPAPPSTTLRPQIFSAGLRARPRRGRYGYLVGCGERVAQAREQVPALVAGRDQDACERATWQQVRDNFGFKSSSGVVTKAPNGAGFDAAGLKLDGSGRREPRARSKILTRL